MRTPEEIERAMRVLKDVALEMDDAGNLAKVREMTAAHVALCWVTGGCDEFGQFLDNAEKIKAGKPGPN